MSAPIRIRYQFATSKQHSPAGMAEVKRRRARLDAWAGPGVSVEIGLPESSPSAVESRTDAALCVPELLTNAVKAEQDGFDAIVISCFSDPGLEAARELVSIPVLGSGICSMHMAAMLGGRFSVLAPRSGGGSRAWENPRKYGLAQNYASTRGVGLSVADLGRDRPAAIAGIAEAGRKAIEEDGADTLILGCMSMAFHDIIEEISSRVGVPVVNPVPASLCIAEGLVRAGLSHSRAAYPPPPTNMFARITP